MQRMFLQTNGQTFVATPYTYVIIHITPYITGYKMQRHQYCCFSLEGAGESVSYSTSPEQDGERGGSGEGDTVPHMDKSERSCVAYCPPPPDDDCTRRDWRVCPPQ